MLIVPMRVDMIDDVERLMGLGSPYVRARGSSDYWLYATLFSATCPVAVDDGVLVGAVVAMRSQDNPGDVYVQDVMVFPVKFSCSDPGHLRSPDFGKSYDVAEVLCEGNTAAAGRVAELGIGTHTTVRRRSASPCQPRSARTWRPKPGPERPPAAGYVSRGMRPDGTGNLLSGVQGQFGRRGSLG
ncbi:hypothetical protein AB0H83_51180 [Dactylosporangium sp. NPDC050688]|uniref:hypothetical protein n=1 Tax=Dactylosporangium sp. NPDC050688 TaxID=3157217 RepID=UPI0033D64B3E